MKESYEEQQESDRKMDDVEWEVMEGLRDAMQITLDKINDLEARVLDSEIEAQFHPSQKSQARADIERLKAKLDLYNRELNILAELYVCEPNPKKEIELEKEFKALVEAEGEYRYSSQWIRAAKPNYRNERDDIN